MGREWQLKLTPPEMARLRDASGIDVYKIIEGAVRFDDVDKACRLAWASIESQAKSAGVTNAEFVEMFGGDEIESFASALGEEMIRFFPSAQRTLAEKVMIRQIRLREIGKEIMSQVTEAMIDEAISKSLSGNSSESSDATPQPSIASST